MPIVEEVRWDSMVAWLYGCVVCFSVRTRTGLILSGTGDWSGPRRPLSSMRRSRFRLPLWTTNLRELQRFVRVYLFLFYLDLFIYDTCCASEFSESGAGDKYRMCRRLLCGSARLSQTFSHWITHVVYYRRELIDLCAALVLYLCGGATVWCNNHEFMMQSTCASRSPMYVRST